MATPSMPGHSSWYRSFYWRIGLGFVACVIGVLVLQSLIFSYMMARPNGMPGRSPESFAAIIAGDVESALGDDPALDIDRYLVRHYSRLRFPVYVVTKDGRISGSSPGPLPDRDRRPAEAALAAGQIGAAATGPTLFDQPPAAMAPIRLATRLYGVVVLPPPPVGGMMRDVGRMLSIPGAAVLVIVTALAAVFIFGPARRRLRALEDATGRLGAGDLTVRAPEQGGDEIARVARAFNRMAAELGARDEDLRTSDRLRRQMLADVSHELNTPLTAMRGYLETLHMPGVPLDESTRARYLDTVERETRRLERIVRDLLDLARFENAAGLLDVRAFAVERVFDHVRQRHEHETETRGIALRVHVDEAADQVVADPDRIEQVIENLVANALRHTPDGGSIDLRAEANGETVCLSVVDSGEGISAEHLPHVFERFYKADASRSYPAGGSGLGLSIAKAIVERHGGTIEAASIPGRTEFRIVLPSQSASANL